MNNKYDIVIIGSGPGGYVCAIRSAQLGLKTALIEKYNTLGGTCLNVGCIPSKALLDASEHFHFIHKKAKDIGINVKELSLDFQKMIKKKDDIVKKITDGVAFLMKVNKIDVYNGIGTITSNNSVKVTTDKEEIKLETKNIVIATGSKPATIPGVQIDKKRIITSTEALSLPEVPKNMIIIGAGAIGLEMGSVYARLGTQITIIEYMDRIIPAMDKDLAKPLQRRLQKDLNIKFLLDHQVLSANTEKEKVSVKVKNKKTEEIIELTAEYCLVATGRKPYTQNLGIENIGIATDDKGRILVNENLQTNIPNIYAIGDVIRGPMLAHKASEEGIFVAEIIAGKKPHINYNAIPSVVYTWPEVACVGKTEQQLKEEGVPYKVGKFPFTALGRAIAANDPDGFVKIITHKETDRLLGMHIFGARAADLIMEGTISIEFKAAAEDLALITHPHPTFSEAIKEAALATDKRALHIKN